MLPTKQLAELIRRKHEILVQLTHVAQRQKEIVSTPDTGTLLKLLATKQTVIDALQQVEHELAPFRAEEPESRTWQTANDRAGCARQAAECNRLLQAVVDLERCCAERMAARRNEVAAQLQQVNAAGHVREAYQANRSTAAGCTPTSSHSTA